MSNPMRIRPVIDTEDAALRRFDKPYTDFADDELVSELLTIKRERHRVTEHIRFERKEIAGLNADFSLVSESRRVPMQPVEGLDGQFECKNVGDCERRLLRQTG